MGFWAKRFLIVIAVIVGAVLVIVFMPDTRKLDSDGNPIERKSIQENMADFYQEFGLSSKNRISQKYGEFVIPLGNELPSQMSAYSQLDDYEGNHQQTLNLHYTMKMRAFAKGSTLMTIVQDYAAQEGIDVIWGLDQDFIIKERFISDNTFRGMLRELAGAIDANFERTVQVYYCQRKNVLLISDELAASMQEDCSLVL